MAWQQAQEIPMSWSGPGNTAHSNKTTIALTALHTSFANA